MNRWILLAALVTLACQSKSPPEGESPPTPTAQPEAAPSAVAPEPVVAQEPAPPPAARAERRPIEEVPVAAPPAPDPAPAPAPAPARTPGATRSAVLAGTWYAGEADALKTQVRGYLNQVPAQAVKGYPIALLAPHAGYQYSGPMAARAYAALQGRTYARVFLMGPAHRAALSGIAFPAGIDAFETPLGTVPLATGIIEKLKEDGLFRDHPSAHRHEHSLEIHLPFLQAVLPTGFELVPMVVSGLNRDQLAHAAKVLATVIGPGDLLIASSDFTHYGERFGYLGPRGQPIDAGQAQEALQGLLDDAWAAIESRNIEAFLGHKRKTGDTICGFLPIALLMHILPETVTPTLLGTDLSGRITGNFKESVSYLSAAFTGLWPYTTGAASSLSLDERKALLSLARQQVDEYVAGQVRLVGDAIKSPLTPQLKSPFGTFVTLKKDGRLRGCIGNIMPGKPLFQAVLDNAVNAAAFDRRFSPVTSEELAHIDVEVSVLTAPEDVATWQEIVLGRDGVILSKAGRSAVFLPQVAPEQGWTLEQTLTRLSQKAGLGPDGWRTGTTFQIFQATVFGEAH